MNHVVLLGAEDVLRASQAMRQAAVEFAQAVAAMAAEHERHEQALRELLQEDRQARAEGPR